MVSSLHLNTSSAVCATVRPVVRQQKGATDTYFLELLLTSSLKLETLLQVSWYTSKSEESVRQRKGEDFLGSCRTGIFRSELISKNPRKLDFCAILLELKNDWRAVRFSTGWIWAKANVSRANHQR